jgi:hypothetical protein
MPRKSTFKANRRNKMWRQRFQLHTQLQLQSLLLCILLHRWLIAPTQLSILQLLKHLTSNSGIMKPNMIHITPHRRPNRHLILAKIGKVGTPIFLNSFLQKVKSLYSNKLQEPRAAKVHWPQQSKTSLARASRPRILNSHLIIVSFWRPKQRKCSFF